MSENWNTVYKSDSTFFGEEPSKFALLCFDHMNANSIKKILELGAGHGRDSIFFASNGIDYSVIAVEILDKITKERRLYIKPQFFDVKNPLPFPECYFDAAYSRMRFSLEDRFIFSEIRRVLKPKGFNYFSVRNQDDKSFGKGLEIEHINGFQI